MEWLNYHHFYYFWIVAKEGTIARASKQLRLAPPTISAQIHRFEDMLGEKLFERQGRKLALTEFGRVALAYAEEIFSIGREFLDTAKGRPSEGRPLRVVVGISDSLTKSIVYKILEPIFGLEHEVRVVCREDLSTEDFMGELATHAIDVVLADAPLEATAPVRAFSHLLGECGTSFLAAPALARACRRGFPRSLDGVPFLLPGKISALRGTLEAWFDSQRIRPRIVADVDDPALAKIICEAGFGVLAAPNVVEKEIRRRYKVQLVGRVGKLRQRFYAISIDRKLRNPAVVAISEAARKHIFA